MKKLWEQLNLQHPVSRPVMSAVDLPLFHQLNFLQFDSTCSVNVVLWRDKMSQTTNQHLFSIGTLCKTLLLSEKQC